MGFDSAEIRMNKTKQSLARRGVRGAWGSPPAPPLALADELLKQNKCSVCAGRPRVAGARCLVSPSSSCSWPFSLITNTQRTNAVQEA